MADQKKLIGTLALNLENLRKDVTQANTILKDLTKIKVDPIDVASGKESIAILRQLEGEFKKLKDASGNSFDTSIFKQMEKALKDLGVSYGTVIQKVTEYKKEFKNEDGGTELRVWKEKTNAINENGKAIEKVKRTLANGDTKYSYATVIDNSAKERTVAYADSIAKVTTEYKKMEAGNSLNVTGIKALKAELSNIQQTYKLTVTEAKTLWTMQAQYTNKINSLNNPKATSVKDVAGKNDIATVQTMYNEMKRENAISISNLRLLSGMLEDVRKKYMLNTTDVNKLTGMQARYTAEINTQIVAENRKSEAQKKNAGLNTSQYNEGYKSKLDNINQSYIVLNSTEKMRIADLNTLAIKTNALISSLGLEGNARKQAIAQAKGYTDEAKRVQSAIDQEVKARQQATAKIVAANEKQALSALKLYTQEKANSQEYSNMSKQLAKISGERQLAMGSGNANNGLMDRVKISAAYSFAAANIYLLRTSIKELISTNSDYEKSLMDLSRTLENVTNNDLKAYGKQAVAYSKEFGQPLKEVQNAMTELARAGINNKSDLTGMSKSVMLGLNTTEISSATEMTGYLVSAVKQLGMSFQDSEKIIDGWNKLGDKYAVKSNDMAEAMQRAGSASKMLSIDLDHLNAMTVVIGEATQKSGSEIGNAIKTMETRLLRPETISTLEGLGVSVMKDAEHFNSFQEIMTSVNIAIEKFGDGTKSTNDILDAIGGAWRKNDISVLAKGWGEIDAIAKESADSAGYSAKENEKAMNTYAKQLEVFKSSIKELYLSVGEAGLMTSLKVVVDGATSVAQALAQADPGMKKFLFTLLEVGVAVKSLSSLNKIVTGLNFTQILDKTGINSFSVLAGGYSKSTTAAKAYQAASASLSSQVAAGNITATESAGILQVVGTKLGLASTSTNVLSAAQTGLQASLARGISLEASLSSQVAAGTLSEQGRKAELLQRMFTEQELQAQQALGIITSEEYNLALRRRSIYEASLQTQINAGTLTQAQAEILLKEKIITQEQYNIVIAQTSASLNVSTASTAGQTASNAALEASQKAVTIGAWAMKAAMLAGVIVITMAVSWLVKHNQEKKEFSKNLESSVSSLKSESDAISSSLKDYTELAKKTNLTTAEKEKLITATQNLIKTIPGASDVINDETKSFSDQTEKLKALAAAKLLVASTKAVEDNVDGNYDSVQKDILSYQSMVEKAEQVASGIGKAYKDAVAQYIKQKGYDTKGYAQVTQHEAEIAVLEESKKTLEEYKSKLVEVQGQLISMDSILNTRNTDLAASNGLKENEIALINQQVEAMSKNGASLENIKSYANNTVYSFKDLSKADPYKQFSASVEEFNKKASHTPEEISKQKTALESLLKDQKTTMPTAQYDLFNKILAEIIKSMNGVGEATKNASNKANTLESTMLAVSKAMEDATPTISSINTVLEKHAETNEWDMKAILKLAETYPQLLAVMNDDKLLAQELTKIKGDSIQVIKTVAMQELAIVGNKLKGLAGGYLQDASNFKTAMDAKNAYLKAFAANLDAVQKQTEASANKIEANMTPEEASMMGKKARLLAIGSGASTTAVIKDIEEYYGLKNMIAGIDSSMNSVGTKASDGKLTKSPTGSNSPEKQEDSLLLLKDRYYSLNQELLKTQNLLDTNASLQVNSEVNDNLKEKIDLHKQEIALLKQKQIAQKNIENEQIKERSELTSTLKSKGVTFSGLDPTNANVILQSKLDSANAHRNDKDKTTFNNLKAAYEDYNTSLERFFTLQNTEIPKSKAEYLSLSTEIYKVSGSLDSLNLDNLTSGLEESVSNSDFLIRNLEFSSKYNYKSDDYINQLEILKQKESTYANMVVETKNTLIELNKTQTTTVAGQKELSNSISSTTETLRGQTEALLDTQEAQKTMASTMITNLIETQKKIQELQMEQRHKNEQTSLASSIYGVSGDSADAIKAAYDKSNQAQQDYYQVQIDNLNKVNDIQTEIETRLKNQNDLEEKKIALQKAQDNKNVQTLTKNSDGSFQFKYVADAAAIETAQKVVDDQITSNNAWEKSTALKHETDRLTALKKSLADQKTVKDNAYNEQLTVLQNTQTIETNTLAFHYSSMNTLVASSLDTLKTTYKNNWADIIKQLTSDVATATALQIQLAQMQAMGGTGNTWSGGNTGNVAIGGNTWTAEQINNPAYQDAIQQAVVSGAPIVIKPFKTGGESSKTGMHWLDGEVGKPERVLSSTQTKDFGQLVTYLPSALTSIESIMDKISLTNVNNTQPGNTIYQIAKLELPNLTNDSGLQNLITNIEDLPRLATQYKK
jgi:TP901 family phage tail tape measure protein